MPATFRAESMFVRRKKSRGGKIIYQLVQTARVNGKVRQRVVAHLGEHPDLETAIRDCKTQIEKERWDLQRKSFEAHALRAQLHAEGWRTILEEDYQSIRQRARYHWDVKPLRNCLWYVERAKKRLRPLEARLARLLRAAVERSACINHDAETFASITSGPSGPETVAG